MKNKDFDLHAFQKQNNIPNSFGLLGDMDLDIDDEEMLVSQLNMDITNQFVVFSISEEEYAIPILSVQEIISLPKMTRIPGVPEYIPGIINLRGNIIPLYELRRRFQLPSQEFKSNTIVIIVEIGQDNKKIVGLIVDSVSDVMSIMEEDLGEKPEMESVMDTAYIKKIAKVGTRMIVIIDINKFFTEGENRILDKIITKNNEEK